MEKVRVSKKTDFLLPTLKKGNLGTKKKKGKKPVK